MFAGVDEAIKTNRAARKASLSQLDGEYAAKGLYRSGPRIREVANRLGQQFEGLAHELFDIASNQPDPAAATRQILDRLGNEYGSFRSELADVVSGIAGGDAAMHAALKILDEARERVERDAAQLIDEAGYAASGFPAAVLVTEDGEVITTEDGEPIELEGHARVTADNDVRDTEDGAVRVAEDKMDVTADDTTLAADGNVRIAAAAGTAVGASGASAVGETAVDASRWTGVPSRAARLVAVRGQIEVAHAAIGYLIDDLSAEEGNAGPLLDEHCDALESLRELHRTLGQLIGAIDSGRLNDEMGEGFAADIARFGGDWLASLRDNQARYVIASVTFAVLTACGLGDWAGFTGGAMLSVPKRRGGGKSRA